MEKTELNEMPMATNIVSGGTLPVAVSPPNTPAGSLGDVTAYPTILKIHPANQTLFPNLATVYPLYQQFIANKVSIKCNSSAAFTDKGNYVISQMAPD